MFSLISVFEIFVIQSFIHSFIPFHTCLWLCRAQYNSWKQWHDPVSHITDLRMLWVTSVPWPPVSHWNHSLWGFAPNVRSRNATYLSCSADPAFIFVLLISPWSSGIISTQDQPVNFVSQTCNLLSTLCGGERWHHLSLSAVYPVTAAQAGDTYAFNVTQKVEKPEQSFSKKSVLPWLQQTEPQQDVDIFIVCGASYGEYYNRQCTV